LGVYCGERGRKWFWNRGSEEKVFGGGRGHHSLPCGKKYREGNRFGGGGKLSNVKRKKVLERGSAVFSKIIFK